MLTQTGANTTMSLPAWVPPTGVSILGSLVAWVFAWRIAMEKFEVKTGGDLRRSEELRLADEKRSAELRAADIQRADELRTAATKQAEELREELREMNAAWNAGVARVQGLAENIANLQGSQNQVNQYQAKALDSVAQRLESHAATLADHTSSIRLLIDKVMAK